MNREIRKLSKKIDELQKQINYQNECIMDQSMIIHKLKEKIVGSNPYKPYTPKDNLPDEYPKNPWLSGNVTCLHCGKDTGIPMLLNMVIPPEGLKCPHCGRTAVYSNSPTYQEPFSTNTVPCNETIPIRDEDNICGGVRVVRETTSVQHISYDGMKTSLPIKMPEKWTGTTEQLNDFLWENRHNL